MTWFPPFDRVIGCPTCAARCDDYAGARDVALVEIAGVYDGGLFYSCSCGRLYHRFTSDHHLYAKAQEVMQKWYDRRPYPPF